MHQLDIHRTEMLSRAYDFGLEHSEDFPAEKLGAEKFSLLGASLLDLLQLSGFSAIHGCSKASARWTLLEAMEAFDRTANAIALDVEGLEDKFRVPWMLSDLNLLRTARTFAEDAAPIANRFIELAMSKTFIEELYGDIRRLEETIIAQTRLRGEALETMTRIDHAIETSMGALIHLDAIVHNTYYDEDHFEPAITWKCIVRHVERNRPYVGR